MFQSFYIFKCNINVSLSNSAPRVSLLACLVPSSSFDQSFFNNVFSTCSARIANREICRGDVQVAQVRRKRKLQPQMIFTIIFTIYDYFLKVQKKIHIRKLSAAGCSIRKISPGRVAQTNFFFFGLTMKSLEITEITGNHWKSREITRHQIQKK